MKFEEEPELSYVLPPPPPPLLLTQSSSSSIPPDHLRCTKTDGKRWRCKGWRVEGRSLCEKHYSLKSRKLKKKVENTVLVNMQPVDQRVLKRTRESDDDDEDDGFFSFSDEEDDKEEESPLIQKKISNKRTCEIKGIEKYNISELLSSLKKSPDEFEMVEKFLVMREEKLKMEKEEAEKEVVNLKEELGIFETMCGQLTSELEEKKREIGVVREIVGELEIKNVGVQDELKEFQRVNDELKEKVSHLEKDLETVSARELKEYQRVNNELKEKVCHLEKDFETVSARERQLQETFTEFIELKVKNVDLESARRRAEAETELWKRRVKELQILLSPGSNTLKKIDANAGATSGLLGNASYAGASSLVGNDCYPDGGNKSQTTQCTQERLQSETRQVRLESEIGHASSPICVSHVKVKQETLEYDRGGCASASSGSISHSSPRGNVAVERDGTECRTTKIQIEAGSASNDASKSSTIKIKEEALDCVETIGASGGATSIYDSTIDGAANVFFPSRHKVPSMQQYEIKNESENRQTKLQGEDSSALNGDKLSQNLKCSETLHTCANSNDSLCSSRGENVKDWSCSRKPLMSSVQYEQNGNENGNTVEEIHSKQFKMSGAGATSGDNDKGKKGKEVDSECDDLTSFLCELRRMRANRKNLKRFP